MFNFLNGFLRPERVAKKPKANGGHCIRLQLSAQQRMCQVFNSTSQSFLSLRDSMNLPKGIDRHEWIEEFVMKISDETSTLVEELHKEECTKESCPKMTAGSKYEYRWPGATPGEAQPLPAPVYTDYLFKWICDELEALKAAHDYDKLLPFAKQALSRLFRVYSHIFIHHWDHCKDHEQLRDATERGFVLLYLFATKFDMIPQRELEVLQSVIVQVNQHIAEDEKAIETAQTDSPQA